MLKSQVTIEYSDDNVPQRIDAIVVSTQHDDFDKTDEVMLAKIQKDIVAILIPRVSRKLTRAASEIIYQTTLPITSTQQVFL